MRGRRAPCVRVPRHARHCRCRSHGTRDRARRGCGGPSGLHRPRGARQRRSRCAGGRRMNGGCPWRLRRPPHRCCGRRCAARTHAGGRGRAKTGTPRALTCPWANPKTSVADPVGTRSRVTVQAIERQKRKGCLSATALEMLQILPAYILARPSSNLLHSFGVFPVDSYVAPCFKMDVARVVGRCGH